MLKYFLHYRNVFVLILISIMALALRVHNLDQESLFMDEILQVSSYRNDFPSVMKGALTQAQPPLDYIIGKSAAFFSNSDFAVRFPAALFGAGTVILIFVLLNTWCGNLTAFAGATLLALSPYHIYYSQEARPYALPMFLLVCLWTIIVHTFETKCSRRIHYILLFIVSVLFLYSRALYPLVVTLNIAGWLLIVFFYCKKRLSVASPHLLHISLILAGAILCYLPMFRMITTWGRRYAPHTSESVFTLISSGFARFSLRPAWEAFLSQSEPFHLFIFLGGSLGILSCFKRNFELRWKLLFILAVVLSITISHSFIYLASTDHPFRPPYFGYLLPGLIIVATLGFESFCGMFFTDNWRVFMKCLAITLILFHSIPSLYDFKNTRKRTDWRGVSQFCAENFDKNHLLIFATLADKKAWKPTFYGFPRYYTGNSAATSIDVIDKYPKELFKSSFIPIFVLFEYNDYMLTSNSSYPMMSGRPGYGLNDSILQEPTLRTHHFRNMWVIEPIERGDTFRDTMLQMTVMISSYLPKNEVQFSWEKAIAILSSDIVAHEKE